MFFALLFGVLTSFAQDGYHAELTPTSCPSESCLYVGSNAYGLISYETQEGGRVSELNTRSNLTDIFPAALTCTVGGEVCSVIEALAGNNERDYMMGGHTRVRHLKCEQTAERLTLTYSEISDYSESAHTIKATVYPCQ